MLYARLFYVKVLILWVQYKTFISHIRLNNNHNKHVDIVKIPLRTSVSERGSVFFLCRGAVDMMSRCC